MSRSETISRFKVTARTCSLCWHLQSCSGDTWGVCIDSAEKLESGAKGTPAKSRVLSWPTELGQEMSGHVPNHCAHIRADHPGMKWEIR